MSETIENGAAAVADVEARELAELERQIAAEAAALDAVEVRRAPKAVDAKRAEFEAVRRKRADAETIEQLELKYGKLNEKIASFGTPEGMIVVQRPVYAIYKRFVDGINPKTGASVDSQDQLVRSCLVHPSLDEYQKIRAERPGVTGTLASLCMLLSGQKEADLGGK